MYCYVAKKVQILLATLFEKYPSLTEGYRDALCWRVYYGHLFLAVQSAYRNRILRRVRRELLGRIFSNRMELHRVVRPANPVKSVLWTFFLMMPVGALDMIYCSFSRNRYTVKLMPDKM